MEGEASLRAHDLSEGIGRTASNIYRDPGIPRDIFMGRSWEVHPGRVTSFP
jgi:hypothetical protein